MASRILPCVYAAALVPALLLGNPANADDGASPAVVDSGPHRYESVTVLTPEIQDEFPFLGTLTRQLSPYELIHGRGEAEESGVVDD